MNQTQGPELIQRLLELAWKPKKILFQTIAVIVAYFVFLFFQAIAPVSPEAAWLAGILIFIGKVLAYFIILLGMTSVAGLTLGEIKEKEVGTSALEKLKDIITSPLKIFAIIVGLVIFHVLIDLWGKIPFVGELCWMFSPLITFPLGIAMVAVFLVLVFGAMLLPTIIILGKEGPVSDLIDFLRKHTIKFAGHFLIALVVAVITFVLLVSAIGWSRDISLTIMGDKYMYLQSHTPGFIRHVPGFQIMPRVQGFRGGEEFTGPMIYGPKSDRWSLVVAGFVYGIIMWLIYMSIWGFILVNFSVAGTLSYVGLTGALEEKIEEPEIEKEKEEKKPAPRPRKPRAKKAAPKKGTEKE